MNHVKQRYDFVVLFDVQDGNPNGDPDAGNLPRIDPETGRGLVTDVCLKRKIRNFVQLAKVNQPGYGIYITEKAVLGDAHFKAFRDLGINTGQASEKAVPSGVMAAFDDLELPEGLTLQEAEEEQGGKLIVAPDADKKAIQEWLKEEKPAKEARDIITTALKDAKPRRPTADETEKGRERMCRDYFDIRAFGAVLSLKSAPNCGQVRGPVQLTFGRSIDPIVALEHSITRMAVATQAEALKQGGDNRTMGRKFTIPYGLYVTHGFISPALAHQTGFSGEDLELLWQAIRNMFEHDRSAARGLMATRRLIVFRHQSPLGNAQAHDLFERVSVKRIDENKAPRAFSDYVVNIQSENLPTGVEIMSF
jgi:CRISPR-associated protein Csd2